MDRWFSSASSFSSISAVIAAKDLILSGSSGSSKVLSILSIGDAEASELFSLLGLVRAWDIFRVLLVRIRQAAPTPLV